MSDFQPLTSIEGVRAQVNYDNIIYIIPSGIDKGSLITFIGGETLAVKETLSVEWPLGDNAVLYDMLTK